MVLGISEIQKLIKEKKLIENLCDREIYEPEGSVIDLRLEKLFKLEGKGFLGIEDRMTPDAKEVASYKENKKLTYTVKPGEYYIAKTIEVINMPEDIIAFFLPRSTMFRSGIIFQSGIANPGFSGPLYFSLFNGSQLYFNIELGARFSSVYFMEVKGTIKNLYRGQWKGGRDAATKLEKQI